MTQQQLTEEQRQELLRAARRTLEVFLSEGQSPIIETSSDALLQKRGAFVSLHKGPALRGCIGTFEASDPLLDTIQRMAVAAASTDPRFPKVNLEELGELTLEISVLSPLVETTPEEIEVGRHGIYITRGFHRGVLLPQVATDNGWDRDTFLEHTCLKAGLPPNAWKDPDARIERFSAEVFAERSH